MRKITLYLTGLILSAGLMAQTPVPAGYVSGTWNVAGSPYLIQGDIQIQQGETLTIEPGVTVEFQGNYSLNVAGQIVAVGTASDSIIFIPADTAVGFNSILFDDPPSTNDSSLFVYCSFTHGINSNNTWPYNCGGALGVDNFSKIRIDHCYFGFNRSLESAPNGYPSGGAIAMMRSDFMICNCVFESNMSQYGGAICAYYYSDPTIENCQFRNNLATVMGGGVLVLDGCSPLISVNEFISNTAPSGGGLCVAPWTYNLSCNPTVENNLFYKNYANDGGGAIAIQEPTEMQVINNTIVYNEAYFGGGIVIFDDADPVIKNTILWGNIAMGGSQVYITSEFALPTFMYSDIEGGDSAFGGAAFSGDYLFNIDNDPLFCDTAAWNFHLSDCSECINAGDSSCMSSNGTRCDIGAYEGDYCPCTGISYTVMDSNPIHIYPNPADNYCVVEFFLLEEKNFRIEIIDLSGRSFMSMEKKHQKSGKHTIQLDLSAWTSGIYMCIIKTDETIKTGKFVVK
jgi:hypothetical protein